MAISIGARHNTLRGLAVATLLVLAAASCKGDSDVAEPVPSAGGFTLSDEQRDRIHVEPVEAAPFHRTVRATGTVAFVQNQSTHVISAVSGTVIDILVPLGATVKAGAPLARVASPDFAAAVSAYRKSAVVAQNLRRIANADKDLLASGNIGRRELEQAQADASAADADLAAASEQLRALGIPAGEMAPILGGTTGTSAVIRSPMDGTVVELAINPGQLLQQGATDCFTIAELSKMWVTVSVFESDVPFIKIGDAAEITMGSSPKTFPGEVEYVSDVVDPSTRAISVRVLVENPEHALKKDAYVNVSIHSRADEQGLLIPVSALLLDSESLPFVFVASADKTFSRRRITTGVRSGEKVVVSEGLRAGEQVVSEGGLFLQFAESQ